MSGHNKWSKIKHKKASTDAKKSREFSKLARFIATESKMAKGDESSPSLRAAIEKARAANMPKDNIDRAVAKGKTDTGATLEPVIYEAFGPAGVALMIEGLTDNRNRTAQEVKHALSKRGYALSAPGAASWAFIKENGGWTATTMVPIENDSDGEALSDLVDALEELEDVQEIFTNAE